MATSRDNRLPVTDLGRMSYAEALLIQQQTHAAVLQNTQPPCIILVEHDPVITISKRKSAPDHLLANRDRLAQLGIEIATTDRGGDITYHGPGQLVAYPIVHLGQFRMHIGQYMRALENAIIQTLAHFQINATTDPPHTGVWTPPTHSPSILTTQFPPQSAVTRHTPSAPTHESRLTNHALSKIAALGVRVRKQITMHGLALNITTNLDHFNTIVPCGLHDRTVTSMQQILADNCPTLDDVKPVLVESLSNYLSP